MLYPRHFPFSFYLVCLNSRVVTVAIQSDFQLFPCRLLVFFFFILLLERNLIVYLDLIMIYCAFKYNFLLRIGIYVYEIRDIDDFPFPTPFASISSREFHFGNFILFFFPFSFFCWLNFLNNIVHWNWIQLSVLVSSLYKRGKTVTRKEWKEILSWQKLVICVNVCLFHFYCFIKNE